MASSEQPENTEITLTGAQETLFVTLYGRWLDFNSPRPLLGDKWSAEVVARVPGKAAETGDRVRGVPSGLAIFVLRTRLFDKWVTDFVTENKRATVVHLACGLDTRALRLRDKCGDGVRWIDVDFPDVIDLRRQIEIPEPESSTTGGYSYEMVASSVVETEWLNKLPTDRPTVIVFEGLTMYLTPEDGKNLIKRLVEHFGSGQMIFDCMPRTHRALLNLMVWVKGHWTFTFNWAIDDPKTLEAVHPRLKMLDKFSMWNVPGLELLAWWIRLVMFVVSWIPILRNLSMFTRFEF
ncbi:leucine carboxyl methyltransferase [Pochonia chlamydosporia 170]|uniref:Leucine carboxyl methyltransferase n=1 Tax=Pochonia chlamydosporia 170 TaxID=1380566 RepID=A0A179G082_METCM|nr:leucine carboxyl methyltransferase [Pochonia chlamydosporia 170]OAQ70649.1 leucine carboxyl methyltransferase [Pochonia chlamydosporia 170]